MVITVNGKQQQVDDGTTIRQLLGTLKIDSERVAVERNLSVIAKDDFDTTLLAENDTLEIVQFVGGG